MWHSMWGWDGGGAWFGLWHLLWWVLIVALAVVVFRSLMRTARGSRRAADRAFEILRERFARGEIDQEEYQQRLRLLKDGPPPRE